MKGWEFIKNGWKKSKSSFDGVSQRRRRDAGEKGVWSLEIELEMREGKEDDDSSGMGPLC